MVHNQSIPFQAMTMAWENPGDAPDSTTVEKMLPKGT